MRQFSSQERVIIRSKVNNYNVDKINGHNVAFGDKPRASGDKKKSGSR
jgi:hypothetical protein